MNINLKKHIVKCIALLALLILVAQCSANRSQTVADRHHNLPDTLRVATLYSPTSYFIYKEEPMGYEYDRIMQFAKDKGIEVEMTIAQNFNALIQLLDSAKVDLIAYEIPITSHYKDKAIPCGEIRVNYQVLVQPRTNENSHLKDVTDLVGKEIYVENDSKYHHRLINLNNELGGGITIHPINRDTLITEDLIEMVAEKQIPLTVVDSDIAMLNKTYHPNIDISLKVSMEQRSAWAVSPQNQWLADSIDAWVKIAETGENYKEIHKRYFEKSKQIARIESAKMMIGNGKISPYDELFKRHSHIVGWDWRILAAQAYAESGFDTNATSWAGARGLMQLMPRTATSFGLPIDQITDPEQNIIVAAKALRSIEKSLKDKISDPVERQKFVIAAYNSGIAHVYDAITIARLTGRDPQKWDNSVDQTILLKSRPEYYSHPEVKYGYFRGTQTVEYVDKVMRIYKIYQSKIPK